MVISLRARMSSAGSFLAFSGRCPRGAFLVVPVDGGPASPALVGAGVGSAVSTAASTVVV